MNDTVESPVLESKRWNFSLRDLLVLMVALGVLFALASHWVNVTRERNRQLACENNLKNLALAAHNHHDVFKRLPYLTSTQIVGVPPGSLGGLSSPPAGYSWGVRLLPYLQVGGYNEMSQHSLKFQLPPFSLPRSATPVGTPFWSVELDWFRCPSFTGSKWATAPEYASLGGTDALGKPYGVATSNYVATSASHLDVIENSSKWRGMDGMFRASKGRLFIDIVDGTSKTFMLCESREDVYSSWYDGTVGWVVAADTNGPQPFKAWYSTPGGERLLVSDKEAEMSRAYWYIETRAGTSLQVGPSRTMPKRAYLTSANFPMYKADRKFGPSSEHAAGVVNHAMGDGSVRAINLDIDPTVYLQLTTCQGREPVSLP